MYGNWFEFEFVQSEVKYLKMPADKGPLFVAVSMRLN